MARSKTPLFDLPVVSVSRARTWIDQKVSARVDDALRAANGACSAIVLQAPRTTLSRPDTISFLCPEPTGIAIKKTSELSSELLGILAPAALLLENDPNADRLFSEVSRAGRLSSRGSFGAIAVTGKAVIGWHRHSLVTDKGNTGAKFTQGDVIAAACPSSLTHGSAHSQLAIQAEIAPIAAQIYAFEVSMLSDYKLRGQHRSAAFKVIPAQHDGM